MISSRYIISGYSRDIVEDCLLFVRRRTKNVGFSEEFLNATCLSVFELWVTRKKGHVKAGGIVLGARGSLKFRDIFQLLLFEARRIGWRENGSIHSIVLVVLSKLWAFVSHALFNI